MDKALRDRTVIEIPMDIFYQTAEDCLNMLYIQKKIDKKTDGENGILKDVLKLFMQISKLEEDENVIFFLTYLSGMSYCVKVNSSSHIKESINFTPRMCETGCHFKAETPANRHNLCGNVYAPSQRALINLLKITKGVAYIRAAKTGLGFHYFSIIKNFFWQSTRFNLSGFHVVYII